MGCVVVKDLGLPTATNTAAGKAGTLIVLVLPVDPTTIQET
jgi:hypothetical protein